MTEDKIYEALLEKALLAAADTLPKLKAFLAKRLGLE